MLLLPHAANYVECKLYHDANDEFHMALGIPTSCVAQDSTLKDVPIVFKYYTPTHACAAVCDSFSHWGQQSIYNEDWVEINDATWQGMRMHAFLAVSRELQRSIAVDFYAAKTIDEILSQQQHIYPRYVRQMHIVEQCGTDNGVRAGDAGEQAATEAKSRRKGLKTERQSHATMGERKRQ